MTRHDAPPMDMDTNGGNWEVARPDSDARTWAIACHLSTFLLSGPIGPLVVWLLGRHRDPFVDDQGKEAMNFQITILLAAIVLVVFAFLTFGIGLFVTVPVSIAIAVANIVLTIIAALKSSDGIRYRYPFTLRLVK